SLRLSPLATTSSTGVHGSPTTVCLNPGPLRQHPRYPDRLCPRPHWRTGCVRSPTTHSPSCCARGATCPRPRRPTAPCWPAGPGASVPALDADALSGLDEDELGVVKALAAGPPIGRTRDAGRDITLERAETPVQRLLARGLLLRRDDQTVELPRELGVALRG